MVPKQYVQHIKSKKTEEVTVDGVTKTQSVAPTPDVIRYGEIAINYAEDCEAMFIKNEVDDIIKFYPVEPLTDEQLALFEYVRELIQKEKQKEFENKFTITTSTSPSSLGYYTDTQTGLSFTAIVNTKFDGTNVDCGSVPGWTDGGVGVYTKTSTSSVAAQAFTYTATSGEYSGMTVTKSSAAKSTTPTTPFYYGWYTSNNANDIETAITSITRYTTSSTGTINFTEQPSQDYMYLWIIVASGRTATAKQLGQSVMDNPVSKTIASPWNPDITLSNYKVYISNHEFSDNSGIEIKVS